MKMKYRTLYHRKSITEINTLQCLHANEVQKIVSHEKHDSVFMKSKYGTTYHFKSITEINILHVSMKMKYRTLYHRKSITEINTLQCLHANARQNIVSHEKHNRN